MLIPYLTVYVEFLKSVKIIVDFIVLISLGNLDFEQDCEVQKDVGDCYLLKELRNSSSPKKEWKKDKTYVLL